jgi:GNAT superfamily N-acetyltransferase
MALPAVHLLEFQPRGEKLTQFLTKTEAREALVLLSHLDLKHWITLFAGERLQHVAWFAVEYDDSDQLMGLASLANQGENGRAGPEIIGIWVHPAHRCKGIGLRLVEYLAKQSQQMYGQIPTIFPVTPESQALCRTASTRGLVVIVSNE